MDPNDPKDSIPYRNAADDKPERRKKSTAFMTGAILGVLFVGFTGIPLLEEPIMARKTRGGVYSGGLAVAMVYGFVAMVCGLVRLVAAAIAATAFLAGWFPAGRCGDRVDRRHLFPDDVNARSFDRGCGCA